MADKSDDKVNEITDSLLKKSKALKERYRATSERVSALKAKADHLLKPDKTKGEDRP